LNCYEFISKGNYDENVIQIVLFGFVFTVAGDGATEVLPYFRWGENKKR